MDQETPRKPKYYKVWDPVFKTEMAPEWSHEGCLEMNMETIACFDITGYGTNSTQQSISNSIH